MSRELLFSLTAADFEVQTFCTGGNGGQHRNAKQNGVRIIHRASGARAEHRDGRDQGKNRAEAFRKLTETPEWKAWHRAEVSRRLGHTAAAERAAEVAMAPENLRVEVRTESGWVPAALAAVVILLLTACGGGGSPAGPTATTTTTLPAATARDGWTGAPVAATFQAGASATTVTAAGYLPRVARATAEPFYLWPQDEEYVRAIVYGNTPSLLYRWMKASVTVQVSPELAQHAPSALAELHEATGLSFSIADAGEIVARFDPADPYFSDKPRVNAYTQIRATGGTITSALTVFRDRTAIDTATLHELGHAVGLTHSMRQDDVMWPSSDRRTFSLSEREHVALRLMYRWRAPGNLAPDREAGASSTAVRTIVVVD